MVVISFVKVQLPFYPIYLTRLHLTGDKYKLLFKFSFSYIKLSELNISIFNLYTTSTTAPI